MRKILAFYSWSLTTGALCSSGWVHVTLELCRLRPDLNFHQINYFKAIGYFGKYANHPTR